MSAAVVLGADAARAQLFVLRRTGSRGYRVTEHCDPRPAALLDARLAVAPRMDAAGYAEVSLAATALANYHAAIGDAEGASCWRVFADDYLLMSDRAARANARYDGAAAAAAGAAAIHGVYNRFERERRKQARAARRENRP